MSRALLAVAVLLTTSAALSAQPLRRLFAPPASGGCPSGQCPAARTPVAAMPAAGKVETVTYPVLLERVEKGEKLTVGFGVPAAVVCTGYPAAINPGVWACFLHEGQPSMPPAALAKAAPAPKKVVGQHSHRCGDCGFVWSHGPEAFGSRSAHTCPNCRAGPWWAKYQ